MVEFAKFIRRLCAAGLAVLAGASSVYAADAERWAALVDTVFTHIRTNELPDSTDVSSLAQDGDGFLWVGSQSGLARWDGYHFRVYRPSADVPDALPDGYIISLHTDPKGRLWVGTNSGGLALHDRERDRFIAYGAGAHGLSHVSVNAIADDGVGGLWVGTVAGLDHLDPATGVVRHLNHAANDSTSLPHNRVLALRRDRNGSLWVGTSRGLARLAQGANELTAIPLPSKLEQAPLVSALFEDSAGRMWIGTRGHGAYVIDTGASAPRPVQETSDGASSTLAHETIRAVAEIRPGVIWIGTDSQGIVAVDTATFRTQRIRHDAALPNSLGDGAVFAIHRDRTGLVWVGTDRSLNRHNAAQTAVSTIFGASSRKDSISVADVAAVLELPNGLIWLGLGNNGIDVIDPRAGVRVRALRPDPQRPERALPRKFISDLASVNNDIYIGTRQG